MAAGAPGDVIRDFTVRAARNLEAANRDAVKDAALVAKTRILEGVARRRGSLTLSRMGRGVKLRVNYTIKGSRNPTALVRAVPPGAWVIADQGAGPHEIRPRRRKGKGGRRAVRTSSGAVYARVRHPGSRGADAFVPARDDARAPVAKVLADRYRSAVKDALP